MTHAADQRYRKIERLRKRKEFLLVQQGGSRFRGKWLTILWRPAETTRFGLTVSKKVGNAPERSHVKRRLREVYRQHKPFWPPGVEFVAIAKPSAKDASYADLRHDLLKWAASVRPVETPAPDLAEPTHDKHVGGVEVDASPIDESQNKLREDTPETP